MRENSRDKAHLADYLNKGFLTFSTPNDAGIALEDVNSVSLRDLGLFASGFEGGLKLTGNTAFTSGQVKVEIEGQISEANAVVKAAETASANVVINEHKIKVREGIGMMVKLGVKNLPTICINGTPTFASIIPDQTTLIKALEDA